VEFLAASLHGLDHRRVVVIADPIHHSINAAPFNNHKKVPLIFFSGTNLSGITGVLLLMHTHTTTGGYL